MEIRGRRTITVASRYLVWLGRSTHLYSISVSCAGVKLSMSCHHVLSEEQAGFRAQRSTVDHIFALTEMLRWRRKRRLQTHCCFLDIRKAYDTLWRDGLWKRLIEVGLRGKMWRVLKNLCDVVESSVLVGVQRTEWFGLDRGRRQGCILSLLLAIFIDGLTPAVNDTEARSMLEGMSRNLLLVGDDIAPGVFKR